MKNPISRITPCLLALVAFALVACGGGSDVPPVVTQPARSVALQVESLAQPADHDALPAIKARALSTEAPQPVSLLWAR